MILEISPCWMKSSRDTEIKQGTLDSNFPASSVATARCPDHHEAAEPTKSVFWGPVNLGLFVVQQCLEAGHRATVRHSW